VESGAGNIHFSPVSCITHRDANAGNAILKESNQSRFVYITGLKTTHDGVEIDPLSEGSWEEMQFFDPPITTLLCFVGTPRIVNEGRFMLYASGDITAAMFVNDARKSMTAWPQSPEFENTHHKARLAVVAILECYS
jgi:hypothetical protein